MKMLPRKAFPSVVLGLLAIILSGCVHVDPVRTDSEKSEIPAGTISAFGGTTIPRGWALCDGATVSRKESAALFNAIGTAFGAGDGTNSFNLPDLRGMFLRGVNGERNDIFADPNRTKDDRPVPKPGGNSGNAIGSVQKDQFENHKHKMVTGGDVQGSHYLFVPGADDGTDFPNTRSNVYTEMSGGNETRPKNIYVNFIIKY